MTNNKQQTAVEWLEQEMLKPNLSMKEILEKAKEMEKEQRSIKLPSDEQIDYAETQMPMNTFELGAKWMRNKIQGGKR
jgi:hypothetical protein